MQPDMSFLMISYHSGSVPAVRTCFCPNLVNVKYYAYRANQNNVRVCQAIGAGRSRLAEFGKELYS